MIKSKQLNRPHLILVVDDQEINRDVLGMILEDQYEVIYAGDGKEAMEIIQERQEELSVIMLDLMMPVMDGFTVLSLLGADDQLKHIPVIVLTSEKEAELKALQLGAVDFITKPFDMHEVILARVARIIELSEGRELISAAEHDKLTGLYSRNFFFEYANRIFRYQQDWRMDAIVMNIEQFHSVNELNGRAYGNKVLCALGDEIKAFLRETQGVASRFEADRFDIYCKPEEDYQALLDRFQGALDRVSMNGAIRLRMGVKRWKEGVEPLVLFDRARVACNMVRGNGSVHLKEYDEKMRLKEILNQRLANDLNRAVENHELKVYFQPKFDVQCDPPRLSSAEALIRWQHPELGMVSPGDFIPLFEGNGQISIVDNYVWAETARQIAEWRKEYGVTLPVSVNLSRVDVFDPALESTLTGLIRTNELDYGNLKLEVTESAYTDNAGQLIELIDKLRRIGFEIEMDDFGSGYSSLNMLSSMPIDVLKMDMKFIRNIEKSEKDMRLVELILDIARSLKLKVVAEGVETESQLKLLKEAGCDLIQGYYFSKPLPPEEFAEKYFAVNI